MPKIVVEGPDGKKYAFPDTMPREEINAFMKQRYGTKARNETVQDYLARVVREQDATKALRREVEREADVAGKAGRAEAAQRMGIDTPFEMAMGANALAMADRAGAGSVYEREGIILSDEAAGLSAINSAGLFIPGMVNQRFNDRMTEARRQNPGAGFVGDLAGGMIGGELIGLGLQKVGQAVAPAVSQIGRLFKGKPAAAAPEPPMVLGPESRILPVDRPDAFPGDDVAIAKALDAWTPPVEQQVRPMGFGGSKKSAGLRKPAVRYKGKTYEAETHGDALAAARKETGEEIFGDQYLGYTDQTGKFLQRDSSEAVAAALSANQITDDFARAEAKKALRSGGSYPLTSDVLAFGFAAPSGSGRRPIGFLDDLERGTDTFYDARLGPEGSDWNKAVEMAKNGYSNDEIAEAIGWTRDSTKEMLKRARNLGIDVPKAFSPGGIMQTATGTSKDVLALKEKGLTVRQISERTGKPSGTISSMLSQERARRTKAGEEIPAWLSPEKKAGVSEGNLAENVFGAAYMSGTGSVAGGEYDLNGDGQIDNTDRAIGSAIGLAAFASPLAFRKVAELGGRLKGTKAQGMAPGAGKSPALPENGYDELKIGKASVEVTRVDDKMTINRLKVPENARGQGEASRALDAVLQQADDQGVTVFLKADPVGTGGMTQPQLEAFYKSRGFVSDGADGMVRKPNAAAKAARYETPGSPEYEAALAKGLDMSTPARMARAKEQGYDIPLFHKTDADIKAFDPERGGRGATFFAGSPEGAQAGAGAGQNELRRLFAREDAPSGAPSIMPVLAKSEGIAGLRLGPAQKQYWQSLPEEMPLSDYERLKPEIDKKLGGIPYELYEDSYFLMPDGRKIQAREIKSLSDAEWDQVKRTGKEYLIKGPEPRRTYDEVKRTGRDLYGRQIAHYGPGSDEKAIAARYKANGHTGYLVHDEGGLTVAIFDPANIRSVHAAFDPDKAASPILTAGFGSPSPRRTEAFMDDRLTPSENKALEMRRNGFSTEEIAEEMDTSTNTVLKFISTAKSKGVEVEPIKRGPPMNRTPDVLRLAEQGLRPHIIAERLGLTRNNVSVLLTKERARLKKAGKPIPKWMSPRDPGGNIKEVN